MAIKRRKKTLEYVKHPRYGAQPHVSGIVVPENDIRDGFWSLRYDTLFPESVLVADLSKQNFSVLPRAYYVDLLRHCRSCERKFIFFAREQRYWFETLKFFVDADCVLCPDCRRASRVAQRRMRRYSDFMAKNAPTQQEMMILVDDAVYLFSLGALRNLSVLGALKNRALKVIPDYVGTVQLAKDLAKARGTKRANADE